MVTNTTNSFSLVHHSTFVVNSGGGGRERERGDEDPPLRSIALTDLESIALALS